MQEEWSVRAQVLQGELTAIVEQGREVGRELAETAQQWHAFGELSREARRQLGLEVEEQLGYFRQGLGETRVQIQSLPEALREVRRQLKALDQQLPEADRKVLEIQGDLLGVKEDLQEIRREVGEVKQEAQPAPPASSPAPEPEPQNRLGAVVQPVVVVAEVLPQTPAERAGMQRGDAITGVNGTPVLNAVELADLVRDARPGEEVALSLLRGGATEVVRFTSEPAPEAPAGEAPPAEAGAVPPNRLGLTAEPGVGVVEVLGGTPAERASLAPGDVIAAVNGTPVYNAAQLREAVQQSASGEEVTLTVTRGQATSQVQARVEEAPASTATPG
jgi:predicted metalloprotease with PDZ domain